MKIIHLCLYGPYTDDFSYQENIIPRYHKKMGHDVTIIAHNVSFNRSGVTFTIDNGIFVDSNGIKIYRMAYHKIISPKFTNYFAKVDLLEILKTERPDVVFVHDAQLPCLSYFDLLKYKKKYNTKLIIVGDIHSDIYNAELNAKKKKVRLKTFFFNFMQKVFEKKIYPMYLKIYCVAQSCYYYAINVCHIKETNLKLLPLGFDTDLYDSKNEDAIRKKFRALYDFSDNDIVIVHGGKLDKKKLTYELINAVSKINNPHVKLLLFGGIKDDYKNTIQPLIEKNKKWITYVGPLGQSDYYDAYISADIAVFPGGQSSLWQEAIGCRLPIVVYYRDGQTQYLNRNGNAMFIPKQSIDSIKQTIEIALNKIVGMKACAQTAFDFFSYRKEAEEIICDCLTNN